MPPVLCSILTDSLSWCMYDCLSFCCHSERNGVKSKNLMSMEKIYKYIEDHASVPSEALDWVVKQTHIRTNHARMLSGAAQGQLLRMLVQMTGATRNLHRIFSDMPCVGASGKRSS